MKNFLTATEDLHFVLLYGSQLGQAKSIAEGLLDVSHQEYNLRGSLFSLNEVTDIKDLGKVKCPVVIVTSTTGDGDPPENADKFWRKLRRKNLDGKTLLFVRYTILGLGDTNFNNFCNCGKTIHRRFQELGATLFYPPGWADDGTGLDLVVDDWIQGLWPALKSCIGIKNLNPIPSIGPSQSFQIDSSTEEKMSENLETKTLTLPPLPTSALVIECTNKSPMDYNLLKPTCAYPLIDGEPVLMTISNARLLTKSTAVKTGIEMTLEFKVEENCFRFQPGDSVAIVSPNPVGEVSAILQHLGVDDAQADGEVNVRLNPSVPKGKMPAHVPTETSIRNLFTYVCDIRMPPKKAFLRLLAESCSDESEKITLLELSSKQGAALYTEKILNSGVSLLDLLLQFPSCKPKPAALIELLPRLQPRAYSICSSPLKSSKSFQIAFNIIEIPKDNNRQYQRLGVCTGWLYEILKEKYQDKFLQDDILTLDSVDKQIIGELPEDIVVFRRRNQNFTLPEDLTAPLVMVGPGTGVAPFVGFLQHRQSQTENSTIEVGENVLYFGCRNRNKDYLYENELHQFSQSGLLTNLYVSFSRDEGQEGIKYVQDQMQKNQVELISILDKGGYFYVCGDAKNMAKNVRETLISCLKNIKGMDEKEAFAAVAELVSSKRYLQDVWA
ncbi:unnamed protein product [Allacma fusca]|uniref:Methionine synthase reductase n=1 Tax=Allacma fusca TaxID=39272 RepID=A0A8J2LG66_9HEXA|nr:unnamed protein product [Allacma fusca]